MNSNNNPNPNAQIALQIAQELINATYALAIEVGKLRESIDELRESEEQKNSIVNLAGEIGSMFNQSRGKKKKK